MNQENLASVFGVKFSDANDNYKARCPFHDDNTPSFLVSKDKYVAHCFGCLTSGPIDKLASEYLSISIDEARARLQIDAVERLNARTKHSKAQVTEVQVYPESWLAPFKKEIHKYVLSRGFRKDILIAAESRFDRVSQRQVFPHRERDGRLLGCLGRTCTNQDPKWYFYWGYAKSNSLYAPFELKPLRPTLVVEGVFDLLWIYQEKVDVNVVATLGAFPTGNQMAALKAVGGPIIAGFDNDTAGAAGSAHLYESCRRAIDFRLVDWPEGTHDWMDLRKTQIEGMIDSAKNPLQLSLRGDSSKLSCPCRYHTYRKERQVRERSFRTSSSLL